MGLRRLFTCTATAIPLFALSSGACSAVDGNAYVVETCPDAVEFEQVSPWLEASCGTLDCHGSLARPMRVYGSRGLRLDPTDMAGGRDTTPQERDASLRSLCGLEPEATAAALAGTLPADELLVVTKARNEVSHKGGQLISEGDSGDRCFVSWLSGHVEPPYCDAAVSP